jgi:hypothetical protein
MSTKELPPFHVIVKFGSGIPGLLQGDVLLDMEKTLRSHGLDAEVFKDPVGDDSKLRVLMTKEQRDRL